MYFKKFLFIIVLFYEMKIGLFYCDVQEIQPQSSYQIRCTEQTNKAYNISFQENSLTRVNCRIRTWSRNGHIKVNNVIMTQSFSTVYLSNTIKLEIKINNNDFIECHISETCDCGSSFTGKIYGGQIAQPHEFPFMAVVLSLMDRPICGATIISSRYLISAAHCYPDGFRISDAYIGIGVHNLSHIEPHQKYSMENIFPHPSYQLYGPHDIAIIKTTEKIAWTYGVFPACLLQPEFWDNYCNTPNGLIAGWGLQSTSGYMSTSLKKANVKIVPNNFCELDVNQICVQGQNGDACQYDSGGPLVKVCHRYFIDGIIYKGPMCEILGNATYTSVQPYIDWIRSTTGAFFCNVPITAL